MSEFTPSEFRDSLRSFAAQLALGEIDSFPITDKLFENCTDETFQKKVTASYIRTICNRVKEVEERGRVSVTRLEDEDRGISYYEVTMVEGVKPQKTFGAKDLPAIEHKVRLKVLSELRKISPDISDLEGEQLIGAAQAVRRFKDVISQMMEV